MSTKTLFKLLWVPFVTSVFASCSDKEELPYTPPKETNDSYISPAVPQGNSWPEASMSLTQPFLGAGYDITAVAQKVQALYESILSEKGELMQ